MLHDPRFRPDGRCGKMCTPDEIWEDIEGDNPGSREGWMRRKEWMRDLEQYNNIEL